MLFRSMLEAILNENEAYQCKLWAVIMAGADTYALIGGCLLYTSSRKYPLLCRLERSTPEGSVTYVLDKSRLSIRLVPPYSEERLAAAREMCIRDR